jgi:hypothetical protein
MNLLGIPVSNKLFKTWSKVFVYPYAPFFLTEGLKPKTPTLHLTRSESRATIQNLSFHDSYATYNVGSEATWVTLVSNQEFQTLPKELRLELLQLQAKLRRGQTYTFDEYKNLLKDEELEQARVYTFEFEGKEILDLNHTLWWSFSFETQKRWLAKFISEGRTDCLSRALNKKEWQVIKKRYPAVRHLVGFADSSGPNCFSTTLAALFDEEKAKSVSSLWLQRETFLREIEKRGYQRSESKINADLPSGSILVWQNDKGIQHACFYIGNGFALNKDAQAWFAPRQILKLESVLESWQDFEVYVYVNHQ